MEAELTSYAELKAEFERQVILLQESCKHESKSRWAVETWAPGHSSGWLVEVCLRCNKVTDRKPGDFSTWERERKED